MPTLEKYRERLSQKGRYNGQVRKRNADAIVEATWYNDKATRRCYLFDYYHDPQPLKLNDLQPDESIQVPIDLKYIVYSSQTYAKDAITYHIQFKPSQEGDYTLVPSYEKYFKDMYDATFPCGLYILIPDDKDKYNKWLIVGTANVNDPQFPTYEILRCDKVLQWIYDNKKYQMCGVLRSQNSYNSGIWIKYDIEKVEDQQKFILPLTRQTEHLFYNLRMIIDNKVITEPRAWKITKVNRLAANGLTQVTLAQDRFDEHKDYIELDDDGNVIGMWADYYQEGQLTPVDYEPPKQIYNLTMVMSYAGTKPEIKVNGSFKKINLKFYENETEMPYGAGVWSYAIKDDGIITPIDPNEYLIQSTEGLTNQQIKLKFIGDASNIGKVLIVTNTTSIYGTTVSASVELEIKSL